MILELLLLLQVDPAKDVVVVVNEALPASVQIGEYYAERRGIPKTQICRVRASTQETVTWPEARKTILDPLREFLKSRPEALYVVPVYGVPVKTSEEKPENDNKGEDTLAKFVTGRDYACIDREIELLKQEHDLDGWLPSKTFRAERKITLEDEIYIVSRLDGPSAEAARALVDLAIHGEAYGIEGVSFLDTRGMKPDSSYGGIDEEMRGVAKVYEKFGLEFKHDDVEAVVKLGPANQAHYWGWYTGDAVIAPDFRFARGAVGAHLHSFSAGVLRSKDKTWTGPLVQHGITGTCGTVYEPLSVGFPFGTIFLDRFLQGYTFGESMQMANMYTSWMAVFVGDPLYAPYAEGRKDAQAKNRALLRDGIAALRKLLDANDLDGAGKKAAELASLPPTDELPALLRRLGEGLYKAKKYEAALGPLSAALRQSSDRSLAIAVGRCHLELKAAARAVPVLEAACAVPPVDDVDLYRQAWELFGRACKEAGTPSDLCAKVIAGFPARKGMPRAAVEKQAGDLKGAAAWPDLSEDKAVGLPVLTLANRSGWDVEFCVIGPISWNGTLRGKAKPAAVPLYPGKYRIAVIARRGKETRSFVRESTLELQKSYALGVDQEFKPYRP